MSHNKENEYNNNIFKNKYISVHCKLQRQYLVRCSTFLSPPHGMWSI